MTGMPEAGMPDSATEMFSDPIGNRKECMLNSEIAALVILSFVSNTLDQSPTK